MPELIITADDYGYDPAYDAGILAAAEAGAIDAAGAFAERPGLDPEPLLRTGVEVGLHLDLGAAAGAPRASADERDRAAEAIARQYGVFAERFGRPPAYLDGHHHCHARDGLGVAVSDFAVKHGLVVRSISARQRRLLSCRGVATPDLLVGRLDEDEPALPAELSPESVAGLPNIVEWMVHPGHAPGTTGSGYDRGRAEDLELLLRWEPPPGLERTTHAGASFPT